MVEQTKTPINLSPDQCWSWRRSQLGATDCCMLGCTGTCSRSVSPVAFCRSTSPQQPLQQSAPPQKFEIRRCQPSVQAKDEAAPERLLQYGSLVQWLIKTSPDYQALGRWASAMSRSIESGSGSWLWLITQFTTKWLSCQKALVAEYEKSIVKLTCLAVSIPFPMSSSTTASQMRDPLKNSLVPSYVNQSQGQFQEFILDTQLKLQI